MVIFEVCLLGLIVLFEVYLLGLIIVFEVYLLGLMVVFELYFLGLIVVFEVYFTEYPSVKIICYWESKSSTSVTLIDLVQVTMKKLFHPTQLFC